MSKSAKKNYNFDMKTPPQSKGLFTVTDPENKKPYEIKNIQISKLQPFKNHPFKPYTGQRFDDMCKSIKDSGVLLPIIVRPLEDELYEILSGHNRVEAAKTVGLEYIPGIVRENLNDDEALLIVTETNLIQRSFADLLHSERAITLKCHMDAIKNQGKRNDLIDEINSLLNADKTEENSVGVLIEHKLKSRDKTAEKYGLSATSVVRYIRLNYLIQPILDRVDEETIGLYPAVSISYLPADEQTELNRVLGDNKYKLSVKKAEMLREYSEGKKLTVEKIVEILLGEFNKKSKTKSQQSYKIKYKIYSKYFEDTMNHAEVDEIIDKALEAYFNKTK